MTVKVADVRGGQVILCDIFGPDFDPPWHECSIADPPYGDRIVNDDWDKIDAVELAGHLRTMATRLAHGCVPGGHFWLWGGTGTPNQRALYRALIAIEADSRWQMAEAGDVEKETRIRNQLAMPHDSRGVSAVRPW